MRPWIVMVTGVPGTGKTTLGREVAAALRLPFLSRDTVRGGMLATAGLLHGELREGLERESAVDALVAIVEAMAHERVSVVVEFVVFPEREEAFRRITEAADVVVLVLEADDAMARAEARDRADEYLNRSGLMPAVGHATVEDYITARHQDVSWSTIRTDFDQPTVRVRTDEGYVPAIPSIVDWVLEQTRRYE